jgi:hypothetical protein
MLWKKGAADIDQRHWFRDVAFQGLEWRADPDRPHLERAWARISIFILGVDVGAFELRLTHNTDTHSRAYVQNNSMTQIHWGTAKVHIAQHQLLRRIMRLYRKDGNTPEFRIEIA